MKKIFTLFLIWNFVIGISILTGCHVNSQRINDARDKDDAEKLTNRFYMYFHQGDYEETYQFLGKKMLETTDTAKFRRFLSKMTEKYGKIKDYKVKSCETRVISGTDPIAQYRIIYENTYENGKLTEDFILEKENETIKINGYHVTTDEF
jgi:hypothetical protein